LIEKFARDKDAISAACLMMEIASYAKSLKKSVLDLVYDIYKKYGIYISKQMSIGFDPGEKGLEQMKNIMSVLRSHPPKTIANITLSRIEDYQTQKAVDLKNQKTSAIKLPVSNVLSYFLSDGTKLVIRPSGTEPKIKIYIEVQQNDIEDIKSDIAKCYKRAEAILDIMKNEIINI
jgi:phosphomannomutase